MVSSQCSLARLKKIKAEVYEKVLTTQDLITYQGVHPWHETLGGGGKKTKQVKTNLNSPFPNN